VARSGGAFSNMDLLERELYFDVLDAALSGVARGTGGAIVLVCGEAGIGKTSLIHEFAARQRVARVLWGGCEALFTPHPLAPVYDIARQADGLLRAALAAAGSREEIFNATLDYLGRGAAPAILVFEDVHWADEATLDFLKFLGRRLARLSVLLVLSYRDDELTTHHPLRSVIGDLPSNLLRRLLLPPFTRAAVATLAANRGQSAEELHRVTGGNPFFVTEALAVPETGVPATVRDAVMARVARLSDSGRRIANLVSLLSVGTERLLLDRMVPVDPGVLEECLRAGMVAHEDGAISFRHEIARRAVEESLPLPLRRELHARILAALLQRGAAESNLELVIHNADKAGDDAAVLKFGPTAAKEASSLGAHREAAAQLATVLAHAESLGGEDRAEFLEQYSYECYLTEQIAKATEARLASLALWQAAGRRDKEGDTLRWLSRLSWFTGNKSVADGLAVQAVEILQSLPPSRELAMAYSNRSQLHMLAGEIEQTLLWGEKAVALARELHDIEIESHALNNVGTARLKKQIASGRADLERSLELARLGRLQEHAARALTNLASSFVELRDFALARRYLGEGIAYCEEHDLGSWARYMVATRAIVSLAEGDWASAALDAESVTRHPQVSVVSRIPALTVLGRIRTRRGDPGAQEILDEAYELALGTTELQRIAPVVVSRAELYWLQGTPEHAAPELRSCYELALQHPDEWKRGELAFWMWRSGCLIEVPTGLAKPYALQIAGNWAAAAHAWEALGCQHERAVALAEVRSEASLRSALAIFEELGARPFADLVRRRLRASGVRRVPRGAQERTRQNPHGLTRRELDVLSLVAEGQRNAEIAGRLFVSEKTVDHHVSAVLAKLNVRSRGEAAVVANRLGLRARVGNAS